MMTGSAVAPVPNASRLPRHDVALAVRCEKNASSAAQLVAMIPGIFDPRYFCGYLRGENRMNDAHSERVPQHRYVIMRTEFRREAANPSGGADRSYAAQGFNSLMTIPLTVWGSLFTKKTERTALPTKAAARSQPRMRRP
jgi:hypothetical protein